MSLLVVGRDAVCSLPSGHKITGEANIAKYLMGLLCQEAFDEKVETVLDRSHADLVWGANPSGFLKDIDKMLTKVNNYAIIYCIQLSP